MTYSSCWRALSNEHFVFLSSAVIRIVVVQKNGVAGASISLVVRTRSWQGWLAYPDTCMGIRL